MAQQTDLAKVLNQKDVLALAFGAMIGWGWVVLAGDWVLSAGSLGAVVAFILGGFAIMLIGLTYAELASAMPISGGAGVFSFRALGVTAGFICTWSLILGYASVVAFEAVALPTVLDYLIPNYPQGPMLWTVAGWDVRLNWALIGIAGSIIMIVLNIFGVRQAVLMQKLVTLLIAVVGIMFVAGAFYSGSLDNAEPFFVGDSFGGAMAGITVVLVMAPFMFVGFDVIPQTAEEINLPAKKIGSVLILSVAMAVVWYVAIAFGVGIVLDQAGLENATLSTADAMRAAFGGATWAGQLLVIGGIAGIVTSWNAFIVGGSRAVYAMSRAKMLPAFLSYVHPKYKTPVNAVILVSLPSVFAPLFGREALTWLVNAGGLAIVMAYGLVAISFVVLRYREKTMPRPFTVQRGLLVGWGAALSSIVMVGLYLPGSPSALSWQEWTLFGVWFALGIAFYLSARLKHGGQQIASTLQAQLDAHYADRKKI